MATSDGSGWDLYREIHKAMRHALFGVTTLAGATDPADEHAVRRLVDEWSDVRLVLEGHHHHEDAFCDELVQRHAPEVRAELEEAHESAATAIAALGETVAGLAAEPTAVSAGELQAFHLALADFTAAYLEHLRFEERTVMPALNRAMADDELEAVTQQIRMSVPPPEMCTFIRYMVPAMNVDERVDMLGGMHAGAPLEIFELFRAAAEACLPPEDYRAVAERAGFA